MSKKLDLSVIILTHNEERHIKRCVERALRFAEKVFVVDSFSTDKTCELAEEYGAIVLKNKYVNQAQQFQWALDNCDIKTDWTMRLDADEYLSPELEKELMEQLPTMDKKITGLYLPLDVIFMEKKLSHGRLKPVTILRVWRTGKVYMEQRWMDERCVLTEGEAITMKGKFIDHNLNGLTFWTQKHNGYSNREVIVYYSDLLGLSGSDENLGSRNSKKSKYYSLPTFLRAGIYFFVRYICMGGFLDGKAGFMWATLQAYWYRFLVDSKLHEIKVRLGKNPSAEDLRLFIKDSYGIDLETSKSEWGGVILDLYIKKYKNRSTYHVAYAAALGRERRVAA